LRGGDKYLVVGDVRNALAGDPSPRAAGSNLETGRGIEVGHIFKLGTKYSEAMGLQVPDEKQQRSTVIMGCYGIGVSRTMAACVEMSHDENGILWPVALAPYHVVLTIMARVLEKSRASMPPIWLPQGWRSKTASNSRLAAMSSPCSPLAAASPCASSSRPSIAPVSPSSSRRLSR
jgi:hypothetical protein